MTTTDDYDPAAHYDRVTRAWGLLLGEELHYGYFSSGVEDLRTATEALTSLMIQRAKPTPGQQVLDVGCGTGAPARRLVEDCGVEVLGISTSAVGVDSANTLSASVPGARFEVRDGTDNGLPDATFDLVWVLESSHLMPDRQKLISECSRVLRPGGRLVLCDIIRRRPIPFAEVRERRADFAVLRAAFGAARMDSLADYSGYAETAGLVVDGTQDITDETLATFDRWHDNLLEHRADVVETLGPDGVHAFERSTEILRNCWLDGTLGYGVLSAYQPSPQGS